MAGKTAHADIVRNPEVDLFLRECEYLTIPSDEIGQALAARFLPPPVTDAAVVPENIMAVDGSLYESSLDERLPSTKIGYVKVGCVLIRLSEYDALRVEGGRFVDPFRVAKLEESNWPLTFPLPSANVKWGGRDSVRDSFRALVDKHLYDTKTRFIASDPKSSLRSTLFHLAALRAGSSATGDPDVLTLHRCPTCDAENIQVCDVPEPQFCTQCKSPVFPADVLRLWEEVTEYQSNQLPMTRFMLVVEHLLPIHYIRYLAEHSLKLLGSIVFFVDGPLAQFGPSAWLHGPIQRFLAAVNVRLAEAGEPRVMVIGLQKTGQIVDHMTAIDRFIPLNRLLAIDDEYRYQYVVAGRDPAAKGFGENTHYGQDFLYKTATGRFFSFALPFPFESKAASGFLQRKTDFGEYSELPRALAAISRLETDLYRNAVVPIALAHRYTAISLVPGGQVLDVLTHSGLQR